MHDIGENAVIDNSRLRWAVVKPNSTISNTSISSTVILPPSFRNGIRHQSGQAIDFHESHPLGGVIVHADGEWTFKDICDWDKRHCEEGAIHIPSSNSCAEVNIELIKGHNNNGTSPYP